MFSIEQRTVEKQWSGNIVPHIVKLGFTRRRVHLLATSGVLPPSKEPSSKKCRQNNR